jgi:FtsH-binding integral membrane protein
MVTRKKQLDTPTRSGGIDLYFKKIFSLMFGAVAVTAITAFVTIYLGGINLLVARGGMTAFFYILLFGGLALSIWAQARAFSLKPTTAAILLFLYAVMMGLVMTPIIWGGLAVNPASIVWAFVIAALMFGCMAAFGYKTAKDLSFLGIFLLMGMIGLILVGIVSMIWTLGGTFSTIICAIGVLVFALFTAYDMQQLKNYYAVIGDGTQKDQLAVLGALHLYISFVAMFQYILGLLNRD